MIPLLIANIQGLNGAMEGEEVDREVSPPILKREKEQLDSPRGVNRELGSPPDTRSSEGPERKVRVRGMSPRVRSP